MAVQFDSDRVRNRVKESLDKLYTDVDPALLNRYRALFKQEVPLFKRSYVAACLLWELDQKSPGKRYPENGTDRYRRSGEEGRAARDSGDAPRTYPLSEEESTRLFFSIGRSRRVFPREILGLIISKTSVSKDDVGAIRILDNYSFVQVRSSVAELIMESLNGKPFRGRPLSVNYARMRNNADTAETGYSARRNDAERDDASERDDGSERDDASIGDDDLTGRIASSSETEDDAAAFESDVSVEGDDDNFADDDSSIDDDSPESSGEDGGTAGEANGSALDTEYRPQDQDDKEKV